MAGRTYRMPIYGDAYQKLQRLEGGRTDGVAFDGDVESGRFSGKGLFEHYRREGLVCAITIETVPFLMSFDDVVA